MLWKLNKERKYTLIKYVNKHKKISKALLVAGSSLLFALGLGFTFTKVYANTQVYEMQRNDGADSVLTSSYGEALSLHNHYWGGLIDNWIAPSNGWPVYRLYNPHSSQHFYTVSLSEKNNLVRSGWRYEGSSFNSGGGYAVYRYYNPISGAHVYQASASKFVPMRSMSGWRFEGVAFWCLNPQKSISPMLA